MWIFVVPIHSLIIQEKRLSHNISFFGGVRFFSQTKIEHYSAGVG